MHTRSWIVLVCVIALTGACGGKGKKSEPMAKSQEPAPAPTSAAITANDLSGTWQLTNADRTPGGVVTITPTDATHVNVMAGGPLSGNYLVQGPHLLILTHDEKLRPLAWQILNRDMLLLTRAPTVADVGADFTGTSLTRGQVAAPSAPAPAAAAPASPVAPAAPAPAAAAPAAPAVPAAPAPPAPAPAAPAR